MAWWITFHTFKGNYSPPTSFNCPFDQGVGGLEGHIGLPALHPVPCLSGSCMGGEGHGRLVYIKYTWSIGNCATWCNIPAPSSCRSLVAFNLDFLLNTTLPSTGLWEGLS